MPNTPTYDQGSQSSVYERLEPDLRKKLDRAIADRQPASLQACYEAFELASHGVSRAAFYRYARRLREQTELHRVADLVHPDEADVSKYFPELINRRLLDVLVNEEASALTIHRLVNASIRSRRS